VVPGSRQSSLGSPLVLHLDGDALYWQLTKMRVECEVVAPSLIPKKSGDRIKTDRRDAEKLAQCYQAGTLTAVWVPDGAHEALRDLVRARGAAKDGESRAKHRFVKYLLHYALRHPESCRAWTHPWWRWLHALKLEHTAQQETLQSHIAEVLHQGERVTRLDKIIEDAIEMVSPEKKAVINAKTWTVATARCAAHGSEGYATFT
jgi:transposase